VPTLDPTVAANVGQQQAHVIEVEFKRGNNIQQEEVPYLLYLPENYGQDPEQLWPLLLFLHGIGERGTDPEKLKAHGPPKVLDTGQDLSFIIASPQCSESKLWLNQADVLMSFLDYLQTEYRIDSDRIYLTGLSMGSMGLWELVSQYPDLPAAFAPVAGAYFQYGLGKVPENICEIKDMPIWIFHGAQDERALHRLSGCRARGIIHPGL
jgi:predicted peptidase